jgi:integral membrane protein
MLIVFRIIALLEGISYILLLGIAVPVKYLANDPQYVKLLGMPHGLLFILYIVMALWLKPEFNWNKTQFIWVLLASIIPFGTLYIDNKYLKSTFK